MGCSHGGAAALPEVPPRPSIPACPWGARWGGMAKRRGQRRRGPAETRRKRELSAGECRGRPRRRGATGKDVSPLLLHGFLPTGEYLAREGAVRDGGRPAGTAQGCAHPIRGALLRSTGGEGPASPAKPLQQLHPSLEHGQGAASPQPPAGQRTLIPCLGEWMGRKGQLSSFPWDAPWQ